MQPTSVTGIRPTVFLRVLVLAAALTLSACVTPDFDYPRESSVAVPATVETGLKRDVDAWLAANPGPAGFYPLIRGNDALGARLRLIERAEKSIDAQYFLMKTDNAGFVFGGALLEAADRGVRVRVLLDDVFTTVKDEELAILDGHPNVELRLYNPIARTGFRLFNFLADFKRANRRMHNKSFIVDNQVAIVGGRNIADEYFELKTDGEFLDFDVVALGPIAADVSAAFDAFWNHQRSLPAEAVVGRYTPDQVAEFRRRIDARFLADAKQAYRRAIESELLREIASRSTSLYSAGARVITDDPEKLVSTIAPERQYLAQEMADIARAATREIIVLSPYFVPGNSGVEFWKLLAEKGVRVVVITNSLASNNHTAVHSGYARYRKDLIRAGVELYEARADAVADLSGSGEQLTMHTKAIIFDRKRLFVGSLNLDPRSIEINSEMGMVVTSPLLAGDLAARLFDRLADWTYRVDLDERDRLRWRARVDGIDVTETSEPLAGFWRRVSAFFLKIVPERQL